MRRKKHKGFLVAAALFGGMLLSGTSGVVPVSGSENLLKNGDFETGGENTANSWTFYHMHGAPSKCTRDNTAVHTGNYSMLLEGTGDSRCGLEQYGIPVQAGKKYQISCWMKGANVQGTRPAVRFSFTGAPNSHKDFLNSRAVGTDWTEFTAEVVAPPGTKSGEILLLFGPASGKIWFDDAAVREITDGQTKSELPQPTTGAGRKENFESDISKWEVTFNFNNALTMGVVSAGNEKFYEIKRDAPLVDTAFNLRSPRFSVTGDKTYTLKIKMKNSVDLSRPLKCLPGGGRSPADTIYWYDQDGKKLSTETAIGHIGPKDETWHTVEITGLKSPANAAMAEIELGADFPDFHDGLYWQIDEITFPEE